MSIVDLFCFMIIFILREIIIIFVKTFEMFFKDILFLDIFQNIRFSHIFGTIRL